MTGVDDLATWLRAQLYADERVARAATPGPWQVGSVSEFGTADVDGITTAYSEPCCAAEDAEHIARWDPTRVLAEVDATRRILDEWAGEEYLHRAALGTAIRILAVVYGDRPGYREEWRP